MVQDVSFTAHPGEVTGYLGPNGSGKSTTLKMIVGLIDPSDGEILYRGQSIHADLITYKQRIGYAPEDPQLYPHLTSAEYLEMVGQLRGLPARKVAQKSERLLDLFSLREARHVPISSYNVMTFPGAAGGKPAHKGNIGVG